MITSRVMCRWSPTYSCTVKRNYHSSGARKMFYQPRREDDFPEIYDDPPPPQNLGIFGKIREGYRQVVRESKLFIDDFTTNSTILPPQHNEDQIFFKFTEDPNCLRKWIVTCDSDYHKGFSKAKLKLSSQGTGIFSGMTDPTLPEDGRTKLAGFCNMSTTPKRTFSIFESTHNWENFNYLALRIRGDGRAYMLNVNTKLFIDLTWNDVYSYVLYTRGGPYWQYVKIPFSKFVFTSRGRVQDRQELFPADNIAHFSITADSKLEGPFKLEIDYISLGVDYLETEETAYEEYNMQGIL